MHSDSTPDTLNAQRQYVSQTQCCHALDMLQQASVTLILQEDFDEEENPDGFTLVGSVPEAPAVLAGVHTLLAASQRPAYSSKVRSSGVTVRVDAIVSAWSPYACVACLHAFQAMRSWVASR